MTLRPFVYLLATPVLLLGCAAEDDRNDMFGDGGNSDADHDGDAGSDGDDDGGDDGGDDSDGTNDGGGGGGVKYDVDPGTGDGPGDGEQGCTKVDFLFVIDSSQSMEDELVNIRTSVPGFLSAIQDTLMTDDFHVMVIDAGRVFGSGCDGELGAGRTASAAGMDCGLGGLRHATADHPDLGAAFQCMAERGLNGASNEETMNATLASLGPLAQPSACNDGFLRDDAILVVTVISDEEDDPGDPSSGQVGVCEGADTDANSPGDPQSWHDAVAAAKAGTETSVVALSIVGDCDLGGCGPVTTVGDPFTGLEILGAEPAPRLRAFAESFTHGSVGPICAPDYSPFFESAISAIETACDDFVPPG